MTSPCQSRLPVLQSIGGAVFSAATLLGGCYSYQSPQSLGPVLGAHVVIRLSGDASRDLALQLGPGVSYVEGLVIANDSAGLHLAVTRVEGRGQAEASWQRERVVFPHGTYLSIEQRRFNLPGTLLFGGLAVGAVVAIHEAFNEGGTLNTPGGGLTNPSQ